MMKKYMAICVPGAEEILKDEIGIVLAPPKNTLNSERGKVFFQSYLEVHDLLKIRCADNIYIILNKFAVGQHKKDLKQFYNNILQTDLSILNNTGKSKIIVSASRSGKHTYSRYDLSDTATEALLSKYKFTAGDEKSHDIAFRIDVKNEACLFSAQLTPPEFRFRGENFQSSRGGIRPSVAHCLIRLSKPKNNDVFYDPFCGAGTIPYERASYKYKKIFASDIEPEAVNIARKNLEHDVIIFQGDAVNTKIKSGSVDTVVTNMPWGKQIEVENLSELHHNFIKELRRILKSNGKAVILTDQSQLLQEACDEWGFTLTCSAELSLHGLHPKIFVLTLS